MLTLTATTAVAAAGVELGRLGGKSGKAIAINASGQVVGDSSTADGATHAFIWTQAGGMVDVGSLGGNDSHAMAVTPAGEVIGYSDRADGAFRGFLWT